MYNSYWNECLADVMLHATYFIINISAMYSFKTFKYSLLAFFFLFSVHAFGQTTQTIKGEVLDLSCYMDGGAKGKAHYVCTRACLAKGLPACILGKDGSVYLLVENHRKADAYDAAIKHGGDIVTITGKVFKKGGIQSLYVESIKVD